MAARTPPPEFPVRTFPAPVISEQVVVEWVTSELANSKPIVAGTPHPNLRDFAGFKLGIQRVAPNDPYFHQRIWVNDQVAHIEAYNFALKYVSESNAHPIFIRSDRELKTSYAPRTKGAALQSVYKLTVSNAGTGYTYGTEPALTFSGGAGSGATGHSIVAPDGTIAEFIIDSGGTAFTSAPTFTVAAPPSGTTATGLAFIQPTSAVLVAEEAQLYPQDSEFHALYFSVIRVYQTLPGPPLYSSDYISKYNIAIPKTEQEVAAPSLAQIVTASPGISYDKIDAVRSLKRTYDPSTIAAYLLALDPVISTGEVNLSSRLPSVLKGVDIITEASAEDGSYSETGTGSTTGNNVGFNLSVRGEAQASSVISFDAVPDIVESEATAVPTTIYEFFLQQPVTPADVLSYLTDVLGLSVSVFPKFYPKRTTIRIKGSRINLTARASAQRSESVSGGDTPGTASSESSGSGHSVEIGTIIKVIEIKPTIHGTLTVTAGIGGIVLPITATAECDAGGGVTASDGPTATPSFSLVSTNLSATTPSSIPTTGLYLLPSTSQLFGYGIDLVRAEVVNMADAAIQT